MDVIDIIIENKMKLCLPSIDCPSPGDEETRLKRASVSFSRIFAINALLISFDGFSSSSTVTTTADGGSSGDFGGSSLVATPFCFKRRTRD